MIGKQKVGIVSICCEEAVYSKYGCWGCGKKNPATKHEDLWGVRWDIIQSL